MAVAATGVEERLLIDGEWVEAADGGRFDVTDPATGEVVGSMPDAGESDVRAAIDAAAALSRAGRRCPRCSGRASSVAPPT